MGDKFEAAKGQPIPWCQGCGGQGREAEVEGTMVRLFK